MDTSDSTGCLDILPDSRMLDHTKMQRYGVAAGIVTAMNWTPVFCANCGKPYGFVPTETVDFCCWLCDPCADKWGPQYGLALMPDEVFQAKVRQEMIEKHGRVLNTIQEIQAATETDCALSKLLREGK